MLQKGLAPTAISYCSCISPCVKAKPPHKAVELLAEMQQKDLGPDAITCSAAICECEEPFPEEMHQKGLQSGANMVTYSTAVCACSGQAA